LITKRLKAAREDKDTEGEAKEKAVKKIQASLDKEEEKYTRMSAEYFAKYNQSAVADDGCGKCETDKEVDPENESIIRAYISFRSMDGLQAIQDTYNYSTCGRRCVELCRCFYRSKYALIQKRYVGGNWPDPTAA